MNAFKVTYTDGTSYVTSANGTAEELKAHLMWDGGRIVSENPVTGQETVRYIATVEQVPSITEQAKQAYQEYSEAFDRRDPSTPELLSKAATLKRAAEEQKS